MKPIFVEPAAASAVSMTGDDSNFPASQLLTRQPSEVARTATATADDVHIDVSFAAPTLVDTAALLFHQEPQGALTLRGAATPGALAGAPEVGSSGVRAGTIDPGLGYRHGFVYAPGAAAFQHWRLTVSGRASQILEAGRLVMGQAFRPTKSLGYGWKPEPMDGGDTRSGPKGSRYVDEGPVRPMFELTFEALSSDDIFAAMLPLLNRCGQTRPFFFCADPDDAARRELMSLYGTFGRVRPAQRAAKRWKLKQRLNGI